MRSIVTLLACLSTVACGDSASGSNWRKAKEQNAQESVVPQVVDGVPRHLRDFPTTCKFVSEDGLQSCTCVLVGSRALLTAAHCVSREEGEDRGKGTVTVFHPEVLTREASCLANAGLDLAACQVDSVGNGPFERLDTGSLNAGSEVLLTGLGCGPNTEPGTLHVGCTTTASRPSRGNNRISVRGPAFLCDQDSGGAAYRLFTVCDENIPATSPRLLAGINSTIASVTSVSTAAADEFICSWARDNAPICGCSNEPESGCRSVE